MMSLVVDKTINKIIKTLSWPRNADLILATFNGNKSWLGTSQ